MYTQCACCVLAWVDIPTYRDMRGCALCILGCREQTNVFLFILLAVGSVPMNRCRHRIPRFFLSLFPPPSPSPFHQFLPPLPTTNESDPTRIPSRFIDDETRSIASSSSFVDRFTPWNLIHCSFRNATNAMARGTASLYMLFSTFLRTV